MPLPSGAPLEGLMPFKNEFRFKLKEHFGVDPTTLPVLSDRYPQYQHANVFLAIEDYLKENNCTHAVLGMLNQFMQFKSHSISELIAPTSAINVMGIGGPKEGPIQYVNIQLAGGHTLACVQQGLYVIGGKKKLAVLLRPDDTAFGMMKSGTVIEVMAKERSDAESFLGAIKAALSKRSIYRGKVISLEPDASPIGAAAYGVRFHTLPKVEREQIILPEGLLAKIERQAVDPTKYKDAMQAARRRIKRGLLLHGPPGTGKTFTAMYLASCLEERTVLLLTGTGLKYLEPACEMARFLQPAMIVIEDVDLIAEEREKNLCNTPLLFELLNQMDGLASDCDVMFLLTTNRPDILEPALAARPGRVDQAYEVPLPDSDCRRRLFKLYSEGMSVEVDDMEPFIKRTEGASAAFINELMRKAALFAAPDGIPIVVKANHLDEALHELVFEGGEITRKLLGYKRPVGFEATKAK